MWKEIGLLGRDKILKQEIYPRLNKKTPFLLSGRRGIGKTALMQWAYENYNGKKAYCSCDSTQGEILKAICQAWNIQAVDYEEKKRGISKAKSPWLKKAILQEKEGAIFFDDVHKATPKILTLIKILQERFKVFLSGTLPFKKEELKRISWGLMEISLKPIPKEERRKLAEAIIRKEGALVSISDVEHISNGYPGRMVAMVKGELETDSFRVEGEELDLSPIFFLTIAALITIRFIGIGLNSMDLYLIGGIGIGIFAFARFFIWKGMKE